MLAADIYVLKHIQNLGPTLVRFQKKKIFCRVIFQKEFLKKLRIVFF
jgi:hypothetical protein